MDSMPRERAEALLREVGRRLAVASGGETTGTHEQRVAAGAALLTALGGDVEVTREPDALYIRGSGCPLSATVEHHPALCRSIEALLTDVTGAPARQCCDYEGRPRCRFAFDAAGAAA
jgi:predicted ArsR family transcriptional regulator